MKKQIFLCGMAALALCACSSDETIETADSKQPVEIAFSPSVAGMTRSVTTTGTLDQFVVNAELTQGETLMHYIKNLTVDKVNGVWKPAQSYSWPYSGTMRFYSYSPASLKFDCPELTQSEYTAPYITYTASSNSELQKDVLYAVNVVNAADAYKPEGSKTVNVNFRHALAQVVFKARCTNPNWILDISDVQIANAHASGVYELPTNTTAPLTGDASAVRGKWSLTEDVYDYTTAFPDVNNIGAEAVDLTTSTNGALLVLPQSRNAWEPKIDPTCRQKGAYFLVRCKIQLKTADGVALLWPSMSTDTAAQVAIPVNINWEEGKKYTYTFVFGDGAGFIPPTNTEGGEDVVPGSSTLSPIGFTVAVDEFPAQENKIEL